MGEGIVDTLVWIIANSPYLVVYGVLGTGIFFVVRKARKHKKDKKQNNKKQPSEEKAAE